MLRCLLALLLLCHFIACTTTKHASELQQGKRYFEKGYYKKALHQLLPLACDGDAHAQYAIGYLYYYGYGVAQDTETGLFWINRSAKQHDLAAIKALRIITNESHTSGQKKS